jgi:hypothetical protein
MGKADNRLLPTEQRKIDRRDQQPRQLPSAGCCCHDHLNLPCVRWSEVILTTNGLKHPEMIGSCKACNRAVAMNRTRPRPSRLS